MSYTYLLEGEEEYSAECFSDIPQSVLLKLNLIDENSCSSDNGTECCQGFQSGMTCGPLTESLGAERLTSYAEDSLARISPPLELGSELMENEADCGNKCFEWFAKYNRQRYLWKTPQCSLFEDSEPSLETWPKRGTMRDGMCFHVEKRAAFICENVSSFTVPTIGKNEFKGSSAKRFIGSPDFHGAKMSEGLRTCATDPQYLHPCFAEAVMGWPHGWTELQPLAMDKFREWLRLHGKPSDEVSNLP